MISRKRTLRIKSAMKVILGGLSCFHGKMRIIISQKLWEIRYKVHCGRTHELWEHRLTMKKRQTKYYYFSFYLSVPEITKNPSKKCIFQDESVTKYLKNFSRITVAQSVARPLWNLAIRVRSPQWARAFFMLRAPPGIFWSTCELKSAMCV